MRYTSPQCALYRASLNLPPLGIRKPSRCLKKLLVGIHVFVRSLIGFTELRNSGLLLTNGFRKVLGRGTPSLRNPPIGLGPIMISSFVVGWIVGGESSKGIIQDATALVDPPKVP